MVKKTRLEEFDSNRSGGVIAINLKDDDELISAQLVDEDADLLLVSAKGMSVRFTADDETLRPMGRATSGVIGMRFRAGDELLAMDTVLPDTYVVTVTDGGFAKRTPVVEWTPKGRGIYGVRAMKLVEERGSLVGALVAAEDDELYAIASDGVVIRTRVADIRATGRDTMGVSCRWRAARPRTTSTTTSTSRSTATPRPLAPVPSRATRAHRRGPLTSLRPPSRLP
jgi:DNA gyrase subunit A